MATRIFNLDWAVAGNSSDQLGPDVFGPFSSLGHNLIGKTDDSSGWAGTDLTGTKASPLDPLLGPLQNNGGPTQTVALLSGSPAIDAGDNSYAPGPNDQRGDGFPRIVNGTIDIGAFEVQSGGDSRTPSPRSGTFLAQLGQPQFGVSSIKALSPGKHSPVTEPAPQQQAEGTLLDLQGSVNGRYAQDALFAAGRDGGRGVNAQSLDATAVFLGESIFCFA